MTYPDNNSLLNAFSPSARLRYDYLIDPGWLEYRQLKPAGTTEGFVSTETMEKIARQQTAQYSTKMQTQWLVALISLLGAVLSFVWTGFVLLDFVMTGGISIFLVVSLTSLVGFSGSYLISLGELWKLSTDE